MTVYAVTVAVQVAADIDDDTVDLLEDHLAAHSEAFACSAPSLGPATVEMVLDVEAADLDAAAAVGVTTARQLLAGVGLPADGPAAALEMATVDE